MVYLALCLLTDGIKLDLGLLFVGLETQWEVDRIVQCKYPLISLTLTMVLSLLPWRLDWLIRFEGGGEVDCE